MASGYADDWEVMWRTPGLLEPTSRYLQRYRRMTYLLAAGAMSIAGTGAMAATLSPNASASLVSVQRAVEVTVTVPPTTVPPTTTVPTTVAPTTTVPASTTTVPPAPPTTRAAPPTTTAPQPAQEAVAVATAVHARSVTPAAPALDAADTCGAALSYLAAHSAPGFQFECPGYALGHQAMTCINVAGACPGIKLIVISVVCPASYMNEAHNSWVLSGLQSGSIDPYGYCH